MPRFLGFGTGKAGNLNLSSYTQVWASCSGSINSKTLYATGAFSSGDRLFIHQTRGVSAGVYEDNQVASYSSGTITLVHPLENTYTDSGDSQSQVGIVKEANSVTGSLVVPAWNGDVGGGVVIACSGEFNASINANGRGYRGGARGYSFGLNQWGRQGEGIAGAGGASTSANGNGGGGAYIRDIPNSEGQGGGGGGHKTTGQDGHWYINKRFFGLGGSVVGTSDLSTIFMGGGGGGGGMGDAVPNTSEGNGQPGGGFIVIYTKFFTSTSSLSANGLNGTNASLDQGGGGAGAGGSILIKSITSFIGTSKLSVAGGVRGTEGSWGGAAGSGRIRIESCSLSGGTGASTQVGGFNYCGATIAIL